MTRHGSLCASRALLWGLCAALSAQIANAGSPEPFNADRIVVVSDDISNRTTDVTHSSGSAPSGKESDEDSTPEPGPAASEGGGDEASEATPDPGGAEEGGGSDEAETKDDGEKAKDEKAKEKEEESKEKKEKKAKE